MSFRSTLAVAIAAQLMMPAISGASLVSGDEVQANKASSKSILQQSRKRTDDGYVLMQDIEVKMFDLDEDQEADNSGSNDLGNQVELNVSNSGDAFAELGFGKQGDEANSTVVLPMNTRFFVADAVIDPNDGQRYVKVELESGYAFWTGLKSFETALYVAEGQVAGRAAGTITSRAGWRVHPISGRIKCHEGTDIAYPSGSTISARVGGGVVKHAGWGERGYGISVVIYHDNGMMSRYAHFSAASVRVGQRINAGDVLGRSGCTGSCKGPHLHYEHKRNGTSVCGGRGGGRSYSKNKRSKAKKKRAVRRSRRARR